MFKCKITANSTAIKTNGFQAHVKGRIISLRGEIMYGGVNIGNGA
jgi:hypothetical protein